MYIKLGHKTFPLEYTFVPTNVNILTEVGSSILKIPAHSLFYDDNGRWVLYAMHPSNPTIYFDDKIIEKHQHLIQDFKEYLLSYAHAIDPDSRLDNFILEDIVNTFCKMHSTEHTFYSHRDALHQYIYQLIDDVFDIYLNYDSKTETVFYVDSAGQAYTIEDFADFLNLA